MPLTRHLYEIDECVSALQLCIRNGWPRALFWLWELIVSQEEELALKTLTDLWLLRGGGYDPYWYQADTWSERYLRLSAAIRNANSLNTERFLQVTAAMPVRPSVTPRPATAKVAVRRKQLAAAFVASLDPSEQADAANFWISFDSACRQHSRTDAFWLLQAAQHQLSADAIWSALEISARGPIALKEIIQDLRTAASPHPVQQILYQAAATLILCTPSKEHEAMLQQPPDLRIKTAEQDWASWTVTAGRRQARMYAIPADALHTETTRGSMEYKYTNIGDVREPVPLLSEGCTFWQKALKAHGIITDEETGATEFPDDDVLESFYEIHFPDDIPDEWSKADQEKSHGRGCKANAAPAPPGPQLREEPVEQRAWNIGIHVRG
jgi:hypothetical protein